jgi:acetyl-CoA acetyltransferase
MRDVYIIGVGMTLFGKHMDKNYFHKIKYMHV